MKDLGTSILVLRNEICDDKIEIDQSKYLGKILVKFGMENANGNANLVQLPAKPSAFNSDTEADDPRMK